MEFTGQIILSQNELFAFIVISLIIGIINGFFSGSSIINRFDHRRRKRIRKIGFVISILFIIIPIINADKFVNPQDIVDLPNELPTTTEDALEIITKQGIKGWAFLLLPLIIPLASFGSTHGKKTKYFMRVVSIISIGVFGVMMLTGYVPGEIAITLFISFQAGIIIGGIAGSGITK